MVVLPWNGWPKNRKTNLNQRKHSDARQDASSFCDSIMMREIMLASIG